jgi:CubicO group peptidase (beta-lactamase class C family)
MIHGLGIHGQYVFADPARKLSVAWLSSRHEPTDDATTAQVLDAVERIRAAV